MKRSTLFIIFCLMLLIGSCASVNSVKVDYVYDPEVDIAALKSYDWLPVPSKSIRYPLIMKQIRSEMKRQLKVRNFTPESAEPDMLIAFHGGIQSVLAYQDWVYLQDNYEQYAIKRRIDMTQYTEDTLMFDFIDTKTGELIYRATATVYLSLESTPEKREKKIHEAVVKVLDSFIQLSLTTSSIEKPE
jgi:hypothetical protein